MRILFEEHQYLPEQLGDIIKDVTGVEQDIVDKKIRLGYVGYFYSPAVQDCVFILPKVLLKDDAETKSDVLAHVRKKDGSLIFPEDIITPEGQKDCLSEEYKKFLYEFSVWVYRAINMYRKLNEDAQSIYSKQLPTEGNGKKHKANTILDIVLSLIKFNRENQNFFMFTIKNLHSGMNKINWMRTISHNTAYIQKNVPIYTDVVNKKKQINFDEELFVIFFSILNYLNEQYGFKAPINCQYELITGRRFENYRRGMGKKRLRQIKYKYFSDKALELWDLCYAFFDSSHIISVNTEQRDYLLAKSFEHVLEAMIDELIGDPRKDIPAGLKDQTDGKRVDHMYTFDALMRSDTDKKDEQVYYIGDSKYYKSGHKLGKESVYKQYTYARNVIQWNIDLFNNGPQKDWSQEERNAYYSDKTNERYNKIRLRQDEEDGENITEGYNVIPNFFLSAFVDRELRKDDKQGNIALHYKGGSIEEHSTYMSFQFHNRLFDRDTLILSHYDVNFLYVLYLYARNKATEKAVWKKKVRTIFRDEIRDVLINKYDFYALKAKTSIADSKRFLKDHFRELNGKILRPFDDSNILTLALEKKDGENTMEHHVYSLLNDFFVISKINSLGESYNEILDNKLSEYKTANGNRLKTYAGTSTPTKAFVISDNFCHTKSYEINDSVAIDAGNEESALEYAFNLPFVKYLIMINKEGIVNCFKLKDNPLLKQKEKVERSIRIRQGNNYYGVFQIDKKITEVEGLLKDLSSFESGEFCDMEEILKDNSYIGYMM